MKTRLFLCLFFLITIVIISLPTLAADSKKPSAVKTEKQAVKIPELKPLADSNKTQKIVNFLFQEYESDINTNSQEMTIKLTIDEFIYSIWIMRWNQGVKEHDTIFISRYPKKFCKDNPQNPDEPICSWGIIHDNEITVSDDDFDSECDYGAIGRELAKSTNRVNQPIFFNPENNEGPSYRGQFQKSYNEMTNVIYKKLFEKT